MIALQVETSLMIDLQQAIGCMINVPEKNKRMMDLLVERG
jgi:hypothetical protein